LAADDYAERDLLLHVEACADCQQRLANLREEITRLRRAAQSAFPTPAPHRNGRR
jgi:hypothetical protein